MLGQLPFEERARSIVKRADEGLSRLERSASKRILGERRNGLMPGGEGG